MSIRPSRDPPRPGTARKELLDPFGVRLIIGTLSARNQPRRGRTRCDLLLRTCRRQLISVPRSPLDSCPIGARLQTITWYKARSLTTISFSYRPDQNTIRPITRGLGSIIVAMNEAFSARRQSSSSPTGRRLLPLPIEKPVAHGANARCSWSLSRSW